MNPAIMEDPPWLIKGSVTPVSGINFKTPPKIMKVCKANKIPIQNANIE